MKLHYLFLKKFNNYFNRKLRYYALLSAYISAAEDYYIPVDKTGLQYAFFDFNPNDNVTAEAVANNCPFDPDYLVIFDSNDNIVYRWFVTEMVRTREGQWRYSLTRDVKAESYGELRNAPVFVDKGFIKDPSNPLLLNHEDVTVNQIKSENEILLKDDTTIPWLVLYLAKGVLTDPSLPAVTIPTVAYDYEINSPIDEWDMWVFRDTVDPSSEDFRVSNSAVLFYNYNLIDTPNSAKSYWAEFDLTSEEIAASEINSPRIHIVGYYTPLELKLADTPTVKANLDIQIHASATTIKSRIYTKFQLKELSEILKYDNKVVKDSDNRLWSIKVVKTSSETVKEGIRPSDGALYYDFISFWNSATSQSIDHLSSSDSGIGVNVSKYRLIITEVDPAAISIDLRIIGKTFVSDSPLFDVIALPYGNIRYTNPGAYLRGYVATAEGSMRIANEIATQLTSSRVLDIQLLPYCPIWIPKGASGAYTNVGGYILSESQYTEDGPTLYVSDISQLGMSIEGSSGAADIIFGVKNITRSFDISVNLTPDIFKHATGINNPSEMVKYVNDCTMLRLCSPNYAGLYEFNLAKNGMSIEAFNVDMTLRPFNPYIHVNPNFKMIYGADTDDQRGLICGGDFSLGILNDQWKQYELQNKNYQAIFDRQIQNLDVNQEIERTKSVFGMLGGTAQGAVSGAIGGTFSGMGPVAGAAIGGGASLLGGIADLAMLDKSQKEQKSFMKDNFKLQLGNVRALPTTITKTSALTANNKIFPFLEIYECTAVEKEAYLNKIRWDGMTIGTVGTIADYESDNGSHYFKGRLLRFDTIAEDSHFLDAIDQELRKGVYI